MNATTIEWTDYTWNPVTGCDKVSAGCRSCYAETVATRFWGDRKFTDVVCHHDRLTEPLMHLKKWHGKKVFVCSMSDLFHESVPFEFINEVWKIFVQFPSTTFQVLTKRPARAFRFLKWSSPVFFDKTQQTIAKALRLKTFLPLPNVWIGVSCENQEQADKRIPTLLQIPAAVRFLSCEPLLGAINLDSYLPIMEPDGDSIDWVIAGGESGHMARPMHPDWVRSLRDQCATANVPFFFKQWGEWEPDSHVSFNGPFFIHCKKHYLIDINGETFPYGDALSDYRRYTDEENSRADKCTLTKEDNAYWMAKVGKSRAGNTLDGKQHLAFPKTLTV